MRCFSCAPVSEISIGQSGDDVTYRIVERFSAFECVSDKGCAAKNHIAGEERLHFIEAYFGATSARTRKERDVFSV